MKYIKQKFLLTISIMLTIVAFHAEAQQAEKKPPSLTVITNVNIFDGKSEKLKTGHDVLIENNLIKQIGKGLKANGAKVIDGGGRTLMPGVL